MISKREVQHVAKLARVGLIKGKEEKFTKEISLIFDYMKKLKELDILETTVTSHFWLVENVMRKDEVSKFDTQDQKLIDGFLKVKSIL